MGIDTQIGEPPRRRPPDPIVLIGGHVEDEGVDCMSALVDELRVLPAVAPVKLASDVAKPAAGTVVLTQPGGRGRVDLWTAGPSARRIGEILGPSSDVVAHVCQASMQSVAGIVLPASEGDGDGVVHIQLRRS